MLKKIPVLLLLLLNLFAFTKALCQPTGHPPLSTDLRNYVEANTDSFSVEFFNLRHKAVVYSIKGGAIQDSLTTQSIRERVGNTPQRSKTENFRVTFRDSLNNVLETFTITNPLYKRIESERDIRYLRVREGNFEIALPADFKKVAFITLQYRGMPTIHSDVRMLLKNL